MPAFACPLAVVLIFEVLQDVQRGQVPLCFQQGRLHTLKDILQIDVKCSYVKGRQRRQGYLVFMHHRHRLAQREVRMPLALFLEGHLTLAQGDRLHRLTRSEATAFHIGK
ncbi:hypothetical protein B9G99_12265 [Kushneria konosiri]|uniref:Uncharacterized protein n=1 Tax=Kushneria konosiri TaxID=698828 RepID=A0A2Z2H9A2_9GAMM|nr:hypothetical protein B9G99_12265 [Kushneria konosiri]